jgi:hypothetical protein
MNNNEDHMSSIQELQSDFQEMQDYTFSLRVRKNITIPPLNEYIKECLYSSLKNITDPRRICSTLNQVPIINMKA